jgi:phenylacetate-coenzyme A ligase PaaK-like adenylate-forming protein
MPFSLHQISSNQKFLAKAMASEEYNKKEEEKQETQQETTEENLRRLLEDARCKSQAYRKILNSLNINTNKKD